MHSTFLLGILLTGSPVVADDAKEHPTRQQSNADLIRRVTAPSSPPVSAMESASATTVGTNQPSRTLFTNALPPLPPLPSGVTELKINEFFRQPIGPRGLEYTEKLRSLEDRRIRILGYMVRQSAPVAPGFLLSPVPLTLNEIEYGHADDLPATTLHVITDQEGPAPVPFTPGRLMLTGKLSLGNRFEAHGRISTVRLVLDPPTPEQKQAAEQTLAATARKKNPSGTDDHDHDHSGHGPAH